VTSRRVLVAQSLGGDSLLDATLQNFEDVDDIEDGNFLKVLADDTLLDILAKLQLLVIRRLGK
jgi:hypothetical protein